MFFVEFFAGTLHVLHEIWEFHIDTLLLSRKAGKRKSYNDRTHIWAIKMF